jgi:hypothetical protein
MNADEAKRSEIPWLDVPTFNENRRKFPQEELLKYVGQYVAWSWDGSRILAGDADREKLDEKLRAAGYDLGRVVHGYVDDPNESWL